MSQEKIETIVDPETVLRLHAESLLSKSAGLPSEDKFLLITLDDQARALPNYAKYTLRCARLLDGLQKEKRITDWIYCRLLSSLDLLHVDFLAVRNDQTVVALQVTSDPRKGNIRRNKIKNTFGSGGEKLIGVVQLVTNTKKELTDEQASIRLTDIINSLTSIGISKHTSAEGEK